MVAADGDNFPALAALLCDTGLSYSQFSWSRAAIIIYYIMEMQFPTVMWSDYR